MIRDGVYALVELPRDKMSDLYVSEDIEVPSILKKLEPQLHVKIGGDEVVLNYGGGGRVIPTLEGVDPVRSFEDLEHIVYLRGVYSEGMKRYLKISAHYFNPEWNVDPSSTWKFLPPLGRTLENRG